MSFDVKFSIIMPNYNGEKYLEKTILSIINQDNANVELIIIDAKSTDRSHSIIEKYANDKTVIWIQEADSGLCDAINIGLRHASGNFIGYSGSDDVWMQGSLARANEILQTCTNLDGFMFDSYSYFPASKHVKYHRVPCEFTKRNLINRYNFIGLQNIFFATDIYKSYRFDTRYKYAMDYELYIRMLSERRLNILHIPVPSTINISDGNLPSNGEAGEKESDEIIARYTTKLQKIKKRLRSFIKKIL